MENVTSFLSGKQAIPIDEYTFPHFIPRLGFLLDDLDMEKGLLGVMVVMVVLMSRMILVVTMCMMLSVKPTQHSYIQFVFSEKLRSGQQQFILKKSTEGTNLSTKATTPYSEIQVSKKLNMFLF